MATAFDNVTIVTIDNTTVYLAGENAQGQKVWRTLPGTVFSVAEEVFKKGRKGTYGAHQLSTGEWSFGWTFPEPLHQLAQPLHLETVVVRSDRDQSVEYHVTVDTTTGNPVSCTCPAGEHGRTCKHLYRGQVRVMGTLREAAQELLRREIPELPNIAAFWAHFNRIAAEHGYNTAIERAVQAAFGNEHPHAIDWKTRQRLALAG